MSLNLRGGLLVAGIALTALLSSPVSATTMTFAGANPAGSGASLLGGSYSEAGFTVKDPGPNGFAAWGTTNSYYAGAGIYGNTGNDTITLTKNDSAAFTINSIDLSELYLRFGGCTVVFTGVKTDLTTVTDTFNVNSFGFKTFVFTPNFDNLTSVSWGQTSAYHQFSNIQLNGAAATPEPGSIAMLATGAMSGAGMLLRRRRARK